MAEPLVSTAWVVEHVNAPGVRLVEIDVDFVQDVPNFPRSNYKADRVNKHLRADRQFILDRLEQPEFSLVDVRSPDEYSGKIIAPPGMTETAQRAGHIPGASNIPWARADLSAWLQKCAQLRRFVDRMGQPDRRPDPAGCGAIEKGKHLPPPLRGDSDPNGFGDSTALSSRRVYHNQTEVGRAYGKHQNPYAVAGVHRRVGSCVRFGHDGR